MSIDTIRTVLTVCVLLIFCGIVLWAYSGRRQERFKRAAYSVLEEDGHVRIEHGGDGR